MSIVRGYGYPIDQHEVRTSDGYLLTMHRIPYSKKTGNTGPRPVVFIMHGLLSSSAHWVLSGQENGLAFVLSDAGYDVWLGNARGNTYSRKHQSRNPRYRTFWGFGWHEIGVFDLPAMFDYVLDHTGNKTMQYIGHSQGTTAFFVLNSMTTRYQNRISSAHMLAPVAWMTNMKSPIAKLVAPLFGRSTLFSRHFNDKEFSLNAKFMGLLGYLMCKGETINHLVCGRAIFLIGGWNSPYLNRTMIPDILATSPAGASTNQLFHYLQEYKSGDFRQFDYGHSKNEEIYGSKTPTDYNVRGIEVPIYLYYSDNDYFANVVDVDKLRSELNPKALKRSYRMPEKLWNHLDFMWGLNAKEVLYDTVIEDMKMYKENNATV